MRTVSQVFTVERNGSLSCVYDPPRLRHNGVESYEAKSAHGVNVRALFDVLGINDVESGASIRITVTEAASVAPFNKAHSAWLGIIDRTTRAWLDAEVAAAVAADASPEQLAAVVDKVNRTRLDEGMTPLSLADAVAELEKHDAAQITLSLEK